MELPACYKPACTRKGALDSLGELKEHSGQVLGELGEFDSPLKHRLVPDSVYLSKKESAQRKKRRAHSREEGGCKVWDAEPWTYAQRVTELSRTPQGRARSCSAEPTTPGVNTPAQENIRSPPSKTLRSHSADARGPHLRLRSSDATIRITGPTASGAHARPNPRVRALQYEIDQLHEQLEAQATSAADQVKPRAAEVCVQMLLKQQLIASRLTQAEQLVHVHCTAARRLCMFAALLNAGNLSQRSSESSNSSASCRPTTLWWPAHRS